MDLKVGHHQASPQSPSAASLAAGPDWANERWAMLADAGLTFFGRVVLGPANGEVVLQPAYELISIPQQNPKTGRLVAISQQLILPRGVTSAGAKWSFTPSAMSDAATWEDHDRRKFAALVAQAESDRRATRAAMP